MNDGCSQWTLFAKHMNVGHHVVSRLLFLVGSCFEVDVVNMSLHLGDLFRLDVQSEFLKGSSSSRIPCIIRLDKEDLVLSRRGLKHGFISFERFHGERPLLSSNFASMVSLETIGSIMLKVLKLVLNLIILILYRIGYSGEFLGVGGTWNLNEDKNPDAEIVASGVFVGFFIYTTVVLISYCFGNTEHKKTLVEIIMNFVGTFMFVAVGGTALHYWHGYQTEQKFVYDGSERQIGLAVGSLCVLSGAMYLLDLILSFLHYAKDEFN